MALHLAKKLHDLEYTGKLFEIVWKGTTKGVGELMQQEAK